MSRSTPTDRPPVLDVRSVRAGYGGVTVIDGLDLVAEAGSITAVVGPNGAGKSTLLRAVGGYVPMEVSRYRLDGRDVQVSSPEHRRMTHALTDDWTWLRGLTVRDHFELFADSDAVGAALDVFGIRALADRTPYSLSAGQAQRAALAGTLVRPWRVLFLDEPEQRLDADFRGILPDVLSELVGDRAIVMATHSDALVTRAATEAIELGGVTA